MKNLLKLSLICLPAIVAMFSVSAMASGDPATSEVCGETIAIRNYTVTTRYDVEASVSDFRLEGYITKTCGYQGYTAVVGKKNGIAHAIVFIKRPYQY